MDVEFPEHIVCEAGVAVTTGAAMIVTEEEAVAAAQPPLAAMEFVTVYVPGVLVLKLIWPVFTFTNTNPAGEAVKVPALAPGPNVGKGLALY